MSRLRPLVLALALCGVVLAPARAAEPVTIHLAGDSTMSIKRAEKRPETGWGERLAEQFRPGTVRVANHAMNGRSTRTFIEEGRWQALLETVRTGDVVLIQFGHNDQSANKPDRYTPPDEYARNLARFVHEVRERDAVPLLLTPVTRRRFDEAGALQDSHGEYPAHVRAVAVRERVALVDMERRSQALLQEMGVEQSQRLFLWLAPRAHPNYPAGVEDNTHFSPDGAARIAAEFASALRQTDLPLAQRLKDTAPIHATEAAH